MVRPALVPNMTRYDAVLGGGYRHPSKLFDARKRERRAPLVCLCFPYAGGNGSLFSDWGSLVSGSIDILAVNLPGRAKRFLDPPYLEFGDIIDDLEVAALPLLDREFLLFGHSLGGLIAYELAFRLESKHGFVATHLFVSGTNTPHWPDPPESVIGRGDYELGDAEFVAKLIELGGAPAELASNLELRDATLPSIRADFRVYDSYVRSVDPGVRILSCPIGVFGGRADFRNVPEESLRDWSRYTRSNFSMHLLPGDHFFLRSSAREVTARMLASIARQ